MRKRLLILWLACVLIISFCASGGIANAQCGYPSGAPGYCIYCRGWILSCGFGYCQTETCWDSSTSSSTVVNFCIGEGYECRYAYSGCWGGGCL